MPNEVDEAGAAAPARPVPQSPTATATATAAASSAPSPSPGAATGQAGTQPPGAQPPGFSPRLLGWCRAHALEILPYCAVRIVGLIVLALMAAHAGTNALGLLGKWDGVWYLGIARHGYDTALSYRPDGTLVNTNVAFFPLYPLLIRVVSTVMGPLHAALLISWVAGIAAAVGIRAVGERLYGKRVGVIAAVLWGIAPTAIVESMAYTESLFTALVAFTLLELLRQRWITAGALALLAGLTHPYGLALAATVAVSALVEIVRRRASSRADAEPGATVAGTAATGSALAETVAPGRWRPWVGGALAPLGGLAFLAWVGAATGRWDGWFYMERVGWDNRPSLGGTVHEVVLILTRAQLLGYYVTLAVVVAALVCAAALTWYRAPLPLLVFTWLAVAMALSSGPGYFFAKGRFLLPVIPLLLPIARHLARSRWRTIGVALGCGMLASAWYGGYLLLIWPHSP